MPEPVPVDLSPVLPPCRFCSGARRFRRGLCRSCYRKLCEHGLPLPPRGNRWNALRGDLADYLRRVPAKTREALLEALCAVAKET